MGHAVWSKCEVHGCKLWGELQVEGYVYRRQTWAKATTTFDQILLRCVAACAEALAHRHSLTSGRE